jgi:type II secretory ATPase GspE/PulE/Tfp pilus assembly ATPase PilB-like protein
MGNAMQKPIEHFLDESFLDGEGFASLDSGDPDFVTHVVDRILAAAQCSAASDVHLQPATDGLNVLFRIDGVLQPLATFPTSVAPNIIARLKVLAELLTYRTDLPQEGRILGDNQPGEKGSGSICRNGPKGASLKLSLTPFPQPDVEMRVSTFPTLHGERAVVRLFAGSDKYRRIDDLGLPADIATHLRHLLQQPAGAIIATGPAGSGKTTTIYACLRELVPGCDSRAADNPVRRNLVSLEDPIEVAVDGVSQSQIGARAGLDLATGLRFLMRQDPEVIMVGEIRDTATAEAALQASLTGHLLLTTFHAGSAVEAIGRLLDMGIEPYLLRSGLLAIVSQHLARRLCECRQTSDDPREILDFPAKEVSLPAGCEACRQSGFRDRFVLAEMFVPDRGELGNAIISRSDTATIERLAVEGGMTTQWQRGVEAVAAGLSSPREIHRVLGVAPSFHKQDEG